MAKRSFVKVSKGLVPGGGPRAHQTMHP